MCVTDTTVCGPAADVLRPAEVEHSISIARGGGCSSYAVKIPAGWSPNCNGEKAYIEPLR